MRHGGVRSILILTIAPLIGAGVAPAQAPAGPSNVATAVRVNVVNVEVYVTDAKGQPVRGLTAADFEVREDGVVVPITNFYASGLALTPAPGPPPVAGEPAVAPVPTPVPVAEPSVEELALNLVVFIDNANIRYAGRKNVLENLAVTLGRVLKTGDRVMVVSYDLWTRERCTLTHDPGEALAALRALGKEAAEGVMTAAERQRLIDMMARDPAMGTTASGAKYFYESILSFAQQRFDATKSELAALGRLVDSLAGVPGRKVVIFVSDGIAARQGEDLFTEWQMRFGKAAASAEVRRGGATLAPEFNASLYSVSNELREVEHRANAGRVTFLTIDAAWDRGMEGASAETMTMPAQPGLGGIEAMKRQQTLFDFARATGGRSLVNVPSLADALTAAAEDLHTFYSLGYTPEHFGDGKYHRIAVTAKATGVTVRHREGYLDKSPEQRLVDRTTGALLSERASNPLGLVVNTGRPIPGKGKGLLLPLIVKIPTSRLALIPQGEVAEGSVSICFVVKDEQGRSSDPQRVRTPMRVPLDKFDALLRQDAMFTFQLLVREGKQRVAVTLQDDTTEEVSTVVTEIDVPARAFLERKGI